MERPKQFGQYRQKLYVVIVTLNLESTKLTIRDIMQPPELYSYLNLESKKSGILLGTPEYDVVQLFLNLGEYKTSGDSIKYLA